MNPPRAGSDTVCRCRVSDAVDTRSCRDAGYEPKARDRIITLPDGRKASSMPKPDASRMGYNPANFAYWIGEEPWVPGYSVYYAISFYDARGVESERSDWWGPKSDLQGIRPN
jgi:hypothetical protein